MRIGFDAKRAFHNERGLGNYSRDLIRIMHENYPEEDYFVFNPKPAQKDLMSSGIISNQILPEGLISKVLPSLWRSYGICKSIKNLKIDLYHGLSQELPFGINKYKVKTVVTFHDAIFMRYPELYDKFYREIFIKKNRYAISVSDGIVAISEQSKRDAIEFFNAPEDKISVVYQGCNQAFRIPVSDEDKEKCKLRFSLPANYILTVSALEERKNLKFLIKSYAISQKMLPLVIVGNESQYGIQLKQLVAELKITENVIFLHQVENVDLPVIYQMASLFVFPSVFEGFGIPILEALCSGVPVITSEGSCFAETAGDAAIYIDPYKHDELAEAMDNVLGDLVLRKGMIEEGFRHAENFTEVKIASGIMNIYKSVL
jgi:glycosyltransferase involved in cell wall biosynthesis